MSPKRHHAPEKQARKRARIEREIARARRDAREREAVALCGFFGLLGFLAFLATLGRRR